MSIFAKFDGITQARAALETVGIDPFGVAMEKILTPTEAIIHGRHTILAGTNNYLGLTFNPEALQAAHEALDNQGTGTTGSRMANGSFSTHRSLEMELAQFYGMRDCIVFSTGYQANLGMIATLAGPRDLVFLDADSHASIYDGTRLGGAEVVRFRHNDPEDLAKRMRRMGDRAREALIIVEGLYSMLGDVAPVTEFAAVKREYGGYLMVDEAHSLGIYGDRGRGICEAQGCEADVDFIVGTFSKSLGATGGFCVSNREELDLIRYAARPYIFTASPPPSVIASTRANLRKLEQGSDLRERLMENATRLYQGLKALDLQLGPDISPVVAVNVPAGREVALAFWKALLENGVYCNLVLPPATPSGAPLLRLSMSAAHNADQVDQIVDIFGRLKPEYLDQALAASA
ncbi:MAG: pyridoxal phosphate-dependent aminotransferase family protein [Wenzhouxiangellaceae bacterium]